MNNTHSTVLTQSPAQRPQSTHSSRSRSAIWWLFAAVGTAAFLTVGTWASYHAELRNDQYQLIHLGQTLYHGGRLYVDCWENKPPGIAWINLLGLWMAGGNPVGAWLPLAPMALAALGLWGVAIRKLFGDATACVSMLLGAIIYSLRLYDSPSINPDFYSSIFELAAFALWCHAMASAGTNGRKGQISWFLLCVLAGIVWLAATAVKQVGCLGLLAVTLYAPIAALRVSGVADRSVWWRGGLFAWFGFLLGLLSVLALLTLDGAEEAWRAIVSFNVGLANPGSLLSRIGNDFARMSSDLEPLLLPMWLALLGFLLSLRKQSANDSTRPMVFIVFTWLVLAAIFALLGPSRAMRYWLALFPPMLFLAAVGVSQLIELFRATGPLHRTTLALVLITIAFMLARPLHDAMKTGVASSMASWHKKPNERDRLRVVGEEVRRRTSPDDRIYVWGFHAGVYVYSDRLPASRFIYPRSPQQADEILTVLEQGRAKLFLMPKGGAFRFDPSCDETCASRIEQVIKGFKATDQIGDYQAWICEKD